MITSYHHVNEPMPYFRAIGISRSNTWIGSSQCFETVYERSTVTAGSEIHRLPSGLFVVEQDGTTHVARFTLPPHIFEAKYHSDPTPTILTGLERSGLLKGIDGPANAGAYREAREAISDRQLRDGFGNLSKSEPSLLAQEFVSALDANGLDDRDICRSIQLTDIGEAYHAEATIRFASGDKVTFMRDGTSHSATMVTRRDNGIADALIERGFSGKVVYETTTVFSNEQLSELIGTVGDILDERLLVGSAPGMS